jgi:cytidine deaminase
MTLAFDDLPKAHRTLLREALKAARRAYAPYSGFAVGSAALLADGTIVSAANMENASYGITICAEVGVMQQAVTKHEQSISAIAVVGFGFWPKPTTRAIVTPCGRCRQIIAEFAQKQKTDIDVICANGDLDAIEVYSISQLLPDAFGPLALGGSLQWERARQELQRLTDTLQGKLAGKVL